MLTFLILFGCAVFCFVYRVLSINKNYWKKRNVVEVKNAAWDFILGRCSLPEIYKRLYDAYPGESYVGMYLGFKPVLILRNLEDVQAILVTEFRSFSSRGYDLNPKDFLADNLLLINDYSRWKLVRQKLSPIFTNLKLKFMYHTIHRCAFDFISYLKNNTKLVEDPLYALSKYSSASISASILGIDSQTNNYMDSPLYEFGFKSADTLSLFTFKAALCSTFPKLYKLLNLSMFRSHEKVVLEVMKKILKGRQQFPSKRQDFIDLFLNLQNAGVVRDNTTGYELEPTDEFLAAQAFSFFLAGVDTTANAMNLTLLELANNPHILQKLHKEIDEAFKDRNHISYEDLDNLQYLNMVISESLRRFPPIGSMQRECIKDTILPSNLKVESGTIVIVPVYAFHMDDTNFPLPHVFDPERFAPENMAGINKFAYIPFGEGNRICIGAKYARLQIKTALAFLLREYTLKTCMYSVKHFDPSFFNLRDSRAKYDIIPRRDFVNE